VQTPLNVTKATSRFGIALAIANSAALLGLLALCTGTRAAEMEAPPKLICLNATETREEVRGHKLLEPFAALKVAAAQTKAEALSAKLCLAGNDFIYEITLLHRDGRLLRLEMEARSGKLVSRLPREQSK
jgi:hypothetical protein